MKFLLIKARLQRNLFKKIEVQYIALKAISRNQKLLKSIRFEATLLLSKLIKKYSYVSFKNFCFLTGRSRGILSFFNLSRIQIRILARNNDLPYVYKSSW